MLKIQCRECLQYSLMMSYTSKSMRGSSGSVPFITLSFYPMSFPSIPCRSGINLAGLLKQHLLVEDHALLSTAALLILHIRQHRINPATGTGSREARMLETTLTTIVSPYLQVVVTMEYNGSQCQ